MRKFVPTVFLIHEFGSCVTPVSTLRSALDVSTEIVFPAKIVAPSAEEFHPGLTARSFHIMPQGMAALPKSDARASHDDTSSSALRELTRKHDALGTFIVLGAGALELRKGVEVFLSTAAVVVRRQTRRAIHFLWVGAGYRPREDFNYSVYLQEQINRSGLTEHVTFLDAVSDLEPIYRITDTFFLSSRLDPLPTMLEISRLRASMLTYRSASLMIG